MRVDSWREILKPSPMETVVYCLLGLGILLGANFNYIFQYFTRDVPIDSSQLQLSVQDQLSGIASNHYISLATIVIFWSIIGLAVYTLFWIGLNFFTEVKNEVVLETDYVNKAKSTSRFRLPLTRFGLGAGVLCFLLISIKMLFPLWIEMSRFFFAHLGSIDIQTIASMLGALVGSITTIYIFFSLIKTVFALRD